MLGMATISLPAFAFSAQGSAVGGLTGLLPLVWLDAADVRRLLGDEDFQQAAQAVLKLSPNLWIENTLSRRP